MANLIQIPTIKDERGTLTVIENILPFDIKRVFYIYDVGSKRGGHRHILNQMALISLNGSVEIYVQSSNKDFNFRLDSPDKVLILAPEDWHTMDNFTKGSILLVLNSHSWDKNDYVHEPYRKQHD